jgi:hypothetical protein
MKKIELKLNGKQTIVGGPGPITIKVIECVKALPEGEYFTSEGLSRKVNLTKNAVEQHIRKASEEIVGYFVLVPGLEGKAKQTVYGAKKSISKLKAQLELE